jgi:hypothetical protein
MALMGGRLLNSNLAGAVGGGYNIIVFAKYAILIIFGSY